MVKEPNLPYNLPLAGERIIEFILFQVVSAFCEMQTASSRIWTWVTMSISIDGNHYITNATITCVFIFFFSPDFFFFFFVTILYPKPLNMQWGFISQNLQTEWRLSLYNQHTDLVISNDLFFLLKFVQTNFLFYFILFYKCSRAIEYSTGVTDSQPMSLMQLSRLPFTQLKRFFPYHLVLII